MIKNEKYLRWIRTQPCLVCKVEGVDAHHLRSVTGSKRGFSMKASGDDWAIPLCRNHHMKAHTFGDETDFWIEQGIDPVRWTERWYRQWTTTP